MKVYIITESGTDNTIRFSTLNKELAVSICNAFGYLGLKIQEFDLIGS